ncbi:hypothetical protein VNO77_07743 [Canavalia gladiata]|uniref:TIR domain-containing protein n=1 Tax=Canavalia gladiata TaxID=3824 RepID=A0AAN9MDF5_CANGL
MKSEYGSNLTRNWIHDVHLSFSPDDACESFVSDLSIALAKVGFCVYRHDEMLKRDMIESLNSIHESRICIIVFSKMYAQSIWCLEELKQIMECHRTLEKIVLPVFYEVDPSEIRRQRGIFGKAFEDFTCNLSDENDRVMSWRVSLKEAASLAGFVVLNSRNGYEQIKRIVQHITSLFGREELFIAEHPVGVKSRVKEVIKLLATELSEDVIFVGMFGIAVAYSEGLPLALLVLGSYLFGRSILEWKGMLNKFQIIPNAEIQASLQVSFDYLLDNEKEIFLDIACFFVGMDKNDVIHILNGCGLSADFGIRSLVERSLVTIDKVNKVGMLHLLRDMGREIIRQESPQEPGKRSRLWFYDDAFDVLSNYEGTPSIRGLALKLRREDTICLNTKAFKGMRRLRLLQLAELHLKSLVVIEFKYSNLKNLWKKNQMLENLKVLNLSHSKYLISTPDFSYMPNLEKLVLEDCSSSFGKAFEKLLNRILENEETVLNWRMALREAGGISGTVIQNFRNQNKVIKNIVERVSRLLNKTELFVPDHLVGIESRLQTTIELLNSQSSKDVLYLGIWGMGGIGKTTIAKAIYNQIGANFEDKSFLSNIREVWEQYTNRVSLQQWVLDDVCKTPTKEIHNIESGKKILKETLAQKKVLLVLDDVNELDQLNALCGSEIGISALVERSLVTIDGKNKLQMHDLLRDMGREIIREKSPEPEERSRLWLTEEVFNVLSQKKGSKAIKGLALKLKNTTFNLENTICFETKTFKKMYNLRLLQLVGVRLDGDYRYLSRDLKWLCWLGFPSTYIPAEFYQESLIAMELKYSNLEEIWMQGQKLENLKVLNLSHSHNLNKTADFSCLPNLEKLLLKDCRSLCTVSNTIGCLNKLLLINLKNCTSLQNLPTSIYKLKALEIMILSGCIMIDKLEDLKEMESLTKLIADNTAIEEVPPSIVNLKSIAYISLCGFEGLSCDVFPSLIRYWRSNNVTSWDPTSALSFPVSLDVPHSNSSSHAIPSTFKVLPNLQNVKSGSQFQVTHDVEMFLDILKSTNHNKEGEASATASQVSDMNTFSSSDRNKQVQIWKEKTFYKSLLIQMGTKCQAPNISSDINFLTTDGLGDSDWSTFSCNGSSVRFELSQMDGCRLKSMILMINYSSSGNITSEGCQNVLFMNCTKRTIVVYKRDKLSSFEDDEWNSITSNLEPGDKMEIIVIFEHGFVVQKTTVYLKYDEPIHEEMENCHAIDKDVTFSGENGDKDVTFSHDDDVSEDKNFAVSGGDENVEATSTASNEFSSQKLTEDPKPGSILVHQNPWDEDHEDEQPPIPLRIRKESNNQKFQFSSEQVESQEMNQGINQNVEVDDSTNLATPFLPNPEQMQVEGNAHIFERKSEDFHGKGNAFSFENQPVDESRPTNPPCSSSMQADSYDGAKEQSVEILEEVSKSITLPFDIESMNQLINDDPLSAIENMLSGEIQQYTTQIDMPKVESSLVNQLLESLKMFLFNKQDMKDALLHEVDTKMVKFIFEELSKVYDQLPAAIKAFIIQSHKFFDEALTHTKKYAHAISKLSSYEQTKKEFIEKARKIKDNDSRLATLTTSSKEKLQVFNTQIVELEKQLEELKKQRDNLQQDMIKCEEQRQNKKIENENFAHQILAILIKMKKNEEDVKTANAGVQASKAIFQELKSNLPF